MPCCRVAPVPLRFTSPGLPREASGHGKNSQGLGLKASADTATACLAAWLKPTVRLQVATAICTVMPIWESRAGLWTVTCNMLMCRPAVDEKALADLKADLEKPHMARVPGAAPAGSLQRGS